MGVYSSGFRVQVLGLRVKRIQVVGLGFRVKWIQGCGVGV